MSVHVGARGGVPPSLFRGSDRTMCERPVSRFGPPAVPPFLFRSFLGTSAPWSVGFCQQSAFLARRFRSAVGIRRLHSMVSSPAFHIGFSRQGVHDHPTSSVVRPTGLPVRSTQFLLIRRAGAWPAGWGRSPQSSPGGPRSEVVSSHGVSVSPLEGGRSSPSLALPPLFGSEV